MPKIVFLCTRFNFLRLWKYWAYNNVFASDDEKSTNKKRRNRNRKRESTEVGESSVKKGRRRRRGKRENTSKKETGGRKDRESIQDGNGIRQDRQSEVQGGRRQDGENGGDGRHAGSYNEEEDEEEEEEEGDSSFVNEIRSKLANFSVLARLSRHYF